MKYKTHYDPEISLADQVSRVFTDLGIPNPNEYRLFVDKDCFLPSQSHNAQRFYINVGLRLMLGAYSFSTTDARFCLVDTGEMSDWLRLVADGVAPCILKNTQIKNN